MLLNTDLNLFVVFEAIYRTGSLTRTAEILGRTQPAISNSLARLRDQFQDPLFIHSDRKMNPTAKADELIASVRQALELFDRALTDDTIFNPATVKKTIKISMGDIAETILLPKFVARLRQKAPGISVEVFQVERKQMAARLAASEIDFAIDIPLPLEGSLRQKPLMTDRPVCAMSRNHVLSVHDKIELEQYLMFDHIHVSYRRRGGGVADIGLSRIGKSRNRVVRLQRHPSAFAMLKGSSLLLTAPEKLAQLFDCHIVDLPFKAPSMDLQLYWHSSVESVSLMRWVREVLIEVSSDIEEQK